MDGFDGGLSGLGAGQLGSTSWSTTRHRSDFADSRRHAEQFDRLFAVNVKAPFFIVQKGLPRLRDGGRIVNVSSGVTRVAYPERSRMR